MSRLHMGIVLVACMAAAGPQAVLSSAWAGERPALVPIRRQADTGLVVSTMKRAWNIWARVIGFVTKPFEGRVSDLQDCFRASIGFGVGLSAEARVGMFTNPALGTSCKTKRFGWESREFCGFWDSSEDPFPLPFMIDRTRIPPADRLVLPTVSYMRNGTKVNQATPITRTFLSHKYTGYWHPFHRRTKAKSDDAVHRAFDFEAGATVAVISARAALNPLEMVDFVLGFFWIDIGRDDVN